MEAFSPRTRISMGDPVDEPYERSLPDLPPTAGSRLPSRMRKTRGKRDEREHSLSVRDLERAVEQWQWEASELRQLLDDGADQLQSEKKRSDELGQQLRESDAKVIAHEVARQRSEMEMATLKEETQRYKIQLEVALREIQAAQRNIDNADADRDRAEEAAARARDRERQLMHTIAMRDAREAGLREGRREGLKEGIARGRAEGRAEGKLDERDRAYRAFDDFLERTWPDGIPDDMETPELRYKSTSRRAEGGMVGSEPRARPAQPAYAISNRVTSPPEGMHMRSPVRSPGRSVIRSPIPPPRPIPVNVQQPQFVPAAVPAFAPPSRRASTALQLSPGQQFNPLPVIPDVPRRSPMLAPTNLSKPMSISPTPSRPHTPMLDIPDGYVPVIRENESISLPPPHEVQPTRGVLPQTEAEAQRMGEKSYDFSRAPSRAPSRASMRAVPLQPMDDIVAPQPQGALDPARLSNGLSASRPGSRAASRPVSVVAPDVGPAAQVRAPSRSASWYDPPGVDPATIPLPYSTAQTAAISPGNTGYAPLGRTPSAVNYPLPPSDNRTQFSHTPAQTYAEMNNSYTSRPASRAPTVAGSPLPPPEQVMLGATLSPPGRSGSRQSARAPSVAGTQYPALPPEEGTVWGSYENTVEGRHNTRAPSVRPASVRPPGTNRTNYPPLPTDGETDYGSPRETFAGRMYSRAPSVRPGTGGLTYPPLPPEGDTMWNDSLT
ncbi:hypothetical protein DACRYDRAFT_112767 [Dacryopinax primogenitus]|uniref:Uncharacterized protein n=1 Tax=Dacryopinax primogenitus (strain DJM 731) TaxID=1858805 RepID=M5GAP3_DACPD|nr:uncharacterized protein DACRYDRAFT_112767 [Dacryopinax primogenitus]EJU05939.1 hypothetical protein DACRYDRAFT_112767 [Dacryopinax primogenitus]